ncbi:TPA: hypothetical protein NMZ95_001853 [Staphylococcus aureus]|nr:hypothetical protein [Staphylococcus aureus]
MNRGLGQFNMEQKVLKELSYTELAMHLEYMTERYKQLNKMEFNCKLPLGNDSYEMLYIPHKTRKEFKNIFRQVMKDKILEAQTEFLKHDGGEFTSNIKEVLGK